MNVSVAMELPIPDHPVYVAPGHSAPERGFAIEQTEGIAYLDGRRLRGRVIGPPEFDFESVYVAGNAQPVDRINWRVRLDMLVPMDALFA